MEAECAACAGWCDSCAAGLKASCCGRVLLRGIQGTGMHSRCNVQFAVRVSLILEVAPGTMWAFWGDDMARE